MDFEISYQVGLYIPAGGRSLHAIGRLQTEHLVALPSAVNAFMIYLIQSV